LCDWVSSSIGSDKLTELVAQRLVFRRNTVKDETIHRLKIDLGSVGETQDDMRKFRPCCSRHHNVIGSRKRLE
jgi:hypothetical protein